MSKLAMYCHKFAASEEKKVLIDVFGESSPLETREETDKDNVLKDVEENEVDRGRCSNPRGSPLGKRGIPALDNLPYPQTKIV